MLRVTWFLITSYICPTLSVLPYLFHSVRPQPTCPTGCVHPVCPTTSVLPYLFHSICPQPRYPILYVHLVYPTANVPPYKLRPICPPPCVQPNASTLYVLFHVTSRIPLQMSQPMRLTQYVRPVCPTSCPTPRVPLHVTTLCVLSSMSHLTCCMSTLHLPTGQRVQDGVG